MVCVEEQADLEPDIYELMSSAHLEDKQLFFLSVNAISNNLLSLIKMKSVIVAHASIS